MVVPPGHVFRNTCVDTILPPLQMAAMRAGSYTGGWAGSHSNGDRDSANPYDMVAEELVSGALRDSLMVIRGRGEQNAICALFAELFLLCVVAFEVCRVLCGSGIHTQTGLG